MQKRKETKDQTSIVLQRRDDRWNERTQRRESEEKRREVKKEHSVHLPWLTNDAVFEPASCLLRCRWTVMMSEREGERNETWLDRERDWISKRVSDVVNVPIQLAVALLYSHRRFLSFTLSLAFCCSSNFLDDAGLLFNEGTKENDA